MNFKRRPPQIASYNPEAFDVANLEAEIGEMMHTSIEQQKHLGQYAPPEPAAVVPIADLTAEAVMMPYEEFAKNVEANREPLRALAMELQTAQADIIAAISHLDDLAKRYRELGESKRDLIQRSAATVAEVNAMVDAVRAKIDPA